MNGLIFLSPLTLVMETPFAIRTAIGQQAQPLQEIIDRTGAFPHSHSTGKAALSLSCPGSEQQRPADPAPVRPPPTLKPPVGPCGTRPVKRPRPPRRPVSCRDSNP